MPRVLIQRRIPVDLSVVEFDLDKGEELFLTYTWDHEHGPGITRDGIGPPKMTFEAELETTNAIGMRTGTWMIRESVPFIDKEISDARRQIEDLERANQQAEIPIVSAVLKELEEYRKGAEKRLEGEATPVASHDRAFAERYPGYEMIAQQGCGDLTMNGWNVAYVNNALVRIPGQPALVCIADEKVEHRTYSALIKWRPSQAGVTRMTIEDVHVFDRVNPKVKIRFNTEWIERSSDVEFAVSNQQVIRDGGIVPAVTICEQFGDLRHLLQLPNLNPDTQLHLGERRKHGSYRPRLINNVQSSNDVWLGEQELLEDESENFLRMALSGPLLLNLPCEQELLRGALQAAGYTEVLSELQPLRCGEWRFVRRFKTLKKTLLEVFFKRNTYGWSMIGLTADNRKLLWLACTGVPGVNGYKLEDAAAVLLEAGAWNALLIDEGYDVMQSIKFEEKFTEMVPLKRHRLRATFIVGRRKEG